MFNKTYSSTGFVIARRKFSEGDRILILFTRLYGKISVIAKGARKIKSRKRGGLEVFNLIKFSAAKSKSIDILTEVEVLDSYGRIRSDLKKVSVAYYFCEVIGKVTRDGEKHEELFEILKKNFEKLVKPKNLKEIRLKFVEEVLISLGFWPGNQKMANPDLVLENIIERKINSVRVGKKMLQQD